jgi:1-acyl-sn-glycerol-3-phosphate acyltransferase
MHTTIFTTPVVNSALRGLSALFLRLNGWTVVGQRPSDADKAVLIAAPHTSNWDLPYTLMVAFCLDLRPYWIGKQSIFRFPFGALMRWLGGVAVDRNQSQNLVEASASALRKADGQVHLIVSPEGTRGKALRWKTGFYFIAQQAGVPIIMAFLDYEKRQGGLGPVFMPTGDLELDMQQIKGFYAGVKGRNPERYQAG